MHSDGGVSKVPKLHRAWPGTYRTYFKFMHAPPHACGVGAECSNHVAPFTIRGVQCALATGLAASNKEPTLAQPCFPHHLMINTNMCGSSPSQLMSVVSLGSLWSALFPTYASEALPHASQVCMYTKRMHYLHVSAQGMPFNGTGGCCGPAGTPGMHAW